MSDTAPSDAQLKARARAIAIAQRQQAARVVTDRTRRALTADGRIRLSSRDAVSGALPRDAGGAGHDRGAEPPLGNPASDGQVLRSTADGERSWGRLSLADLTDVLLTDLEDGQVLVYDAASGLWRNGTILYPVALEPLVLDSETLIFDGDVLTIGVG